MNYRETNCSRLAGLILLSLTACGGNNLSSTQLGSNPATPTATPIVGAPTLYLASAATAPTAGSAVLGIVTANQPADTLTATLISDSKCAASTSNLSIVSNNLVYTPCTVTNANSGASSISYRIDDITNNAYVTGTYSVILAVDNTTAANNQTVTYNWSAATPTWDSAVAAVRLGTSSARARLLFLGDSTTQGHGEETGSSTIQQGQGRSVPELLASAWTTLGLATQNASAYNPSTALNALISYAAGTTVSSIGGPGGNMVQTNASADGVNYNTSGFASFDHVDVLYYDSQGTFTVAVDGNAVSCTSAGANSGLNLVFSCAVPSGVHSTVSLRQTGSSSAYLQGLSVWSSTSPKVEFENVAIGGAFSSTLNVVYPAPQYNYGQMAGGYALHPQMVFLDFGINDITNNTTTNQAGSNTVIQQMVANFQQAITSFKTVGADVILVIPQPFVSTTYYPLLMPQWRAAAVQLAYSNQIRVIDLSATFENDPYAISRFDNLHPDAAGYTAIANAYKSVFHP